jgi:hypothetical protein
MSLLVHIIATMTFGAIVAFVIPFVALLTSTLVTWREEHLWNFSVLQRAHLSNLVNKFNIQFYKSPFIK